MTPHVTLGADDFSLPTAGLIALRQKNSSTGVTLLQRRVANMLMHTVLNDKKTSHCRGTACQSSPERGRGLWVHTAHSAAGPPHQGSERPGPIQELSDSSTAVPPAGGVSPAHPAGSQEPPDDQDGRTAALQTLSSDVQSSPVILASGAVVHFTQLYELLVEEDTIINTAAETAKCTFFPKREFLLFYLWG